MRQVTASGRWIWGLSGLVTAVALAILGARLITMTGGPSNVQVEPQAIMIRTLTVPQPVTSLTVQSYGGQVQVTAGPVSRVRVTETIMYDSPGGVASAVPEPVSVGGLGQGNQGNLADGVPPVPEPVSVGGLGQGNQGNLADGVPAVPESVSGGRLSLGDPVCASSDCAVNFAVTVPSDVTVTVATQGGGPVSVSGIAGADLNSDGGPVRARRIGGPLTVTTGGGPLTVNGVTGPLYADTDGGTLIARGVTAATATVTTGGGPAQLAFSAAPAKVRVSTDGGPVLLTVPGGPYALTADSGGGPQQVGIATDPSARSSITITSGGGPLQVEPASGPGNPG